MNDSGMAEGADQHLVQGVLARDLRLLAKTITLVESTHPEHQARARKVLDALLPHTGHSFRVGISGPPGSGKSTFVEAFGLYVLKQGRRIAILAVDPSSTISGGSILADKTRMERLAQSPDAYIRPSPSSGSLGGVADKTREAMLVCEAAGFDLVVVETVGVGQSEAAVAGMVDFFALLQTPHTGDDLQAMKKGIAEFADVVVVNKADLDPAAAEHSRFQLEQAIAAQTTSLGWQRRAIALSALAGTGMKDFWAAIQDFHRGVAGNGEFERKRKRQGVEWMWALIDSALRSQFRQHPQVRRNLDAACAAVAEGKLAPGAAAEQLLAQMKNA